MKAVIWYDWRLCRRSAAFWLTAIVSPVAIALLSLQGALVCDGHVFAAVFDLCYGIPACGWVSALVVVMHSLGASDGRHGQRLNRFMEEAYRESGRPMVGMLLAHTVLPFAASVPMAMLFVACHLCWGFIDMNDLGSPAAWCGYGCTVLTILFTTALATLATARNTEGLIGILMLAALPIPAVTTGVIISIAFDRAAVVIIATILIAAVLVGIAATIYRHRYVTTLRFRTVPGHRKHLSRICHDHSAKNKAVTRDGA